LCGRPRASLEEKLRLAFSLFDANGSGRIDGPELFQLLRLMTGRVHDDKDLQAITNGYLRRFPSGFTFEIFCQMVDISDLNRLTLSL